MDCVWGGYRVSGFVVLGRNVVSVGYEDLVCSKGVENFGWICWGFKVMVRDGWGYWNVEIKIVICWLL